MFFCLRRRRKEKAIMAACSDKAVLVVWGIKKDFTGK